MTELGARRSVNLLTHSDSQRAHDCPGGPLLSRRRLRSEVASCQYAPSAAPKSASSSVCSSLNSNCDFSNGDTSADPPAVDSISHDEPRGLEPRCGPLPPSNLPNKDDVRGAARFPVAISYPEQRAIVIIKGAAHESGLLRTKWQCARRP